MYIDLLNIAEAVKAVVKKYFLYISYVIKMRVRGRKFAKICYLCILYRYNCVVCNK